MPYNYGAKNGPSIGKAAPGLPVPAKYDNTLNISTSQLVATGRKFINPNFNDRSDWTKVTNAAAIGSATVSAVQNVPSSTNMLIQPNNGGIFAGALKISDTAFVALTSEVSNTNKTNLTLFDVRDGGCSVKSQIPLSTDTAGGCGSAQIIPSSRPDLILVTRKLYANSHQVVEFFRVDENSGSISNANTGTQASSTALSASNSNWNIPWVINPLGYFAGREVWVACSKVTSTCYFITLDDAGNSVITSVSFQAGFLQRVGEDANNIYVSGIAHPNNGGSFGTSNYYRFSPFRIYAINKSSLAVTSILTQTSYNGGVFGVSHQTYYFGGFVSYGFNGEGFFLDFDVNGDPADASFAVSNSHSASTLFRADLRDLSRMAAQYMGRSPTAAACSFVAVSPDVVAARGTSTTPWSGACYENMNSRSILSFGWLDAFGNPKSSYVTLSGLGSGGAARSTQMVPFGDRLLVLDKPQNDSSAVQFVWVYPR